MQVSTYKLRPLLPPKDDLHDCSRVRKWYGLLFIYLERRVRLGCTKRTN